MPGETPQSIPVWFDWDCVRLRIGPVEDRPKLRNLRRAPRLAVSIVNRAVPPRFMEILGRAAFEADPGQSTLARIIRSRNRPRKRGVR